MKRIVAPPNYQEILGSTRKLNTVASIATLVGIVCIIGAVVSIGTIVYEIYEMISTHSHHLPEHPDAEYLIVLATLFIIWGLVSLAVSAFLHTIAHAASAIRDIARSSHITSQHVTPDAPSLLQQVQ